MLKANLNSKLAALILGILLIGVFYLIGSELLLTKQEIDNLNQQIKISESLLGQIKEEKVKVLYLINKGDGEINSYQISPFPNSTVFSLLEELAGRENFEIEYKIYEDMGVFIESIAGLKGGEDNKWWQYWVNGELPMVAADKKEVKGGDKIEWKFAPSPF